jgi:hypothetical protein
MEAIDFPDIESAVITYLRTELAALGETATVSDSGYKPSSTTKRPERLVVVQRIGGPRLDLVRDSANLDIHCYATDAYALVRKVRALVGKLQGETISGAHVYRVQEFAGPAKLPHPASSTPRYVFAVRLDFRGSAL